MNDIQLLPLYSNVILFADDTTIFNSHKSQKLLKYSLEHDLNLMIDWFKANKLSLNLSKMIGIKFWDNNMNMTINVDKINIQMTECTKFLRVYIDYKLAWHIHVNHLLDTLNTNRRVFRKKPTGHSMYEKHLLWTHSLTHPLWNFCVG